MYWLLYVLLRFGIVRLLTVKIVPLRKTTGGQGTVEYALLLGLIALALIGVIWSLGPAIVDVFNNVTHDVAPNPPADFDDLTPAPPLP